VPFVELRALEQVGLPVDTIVLRDAGGEQIATLSLEGVGLMISQADVEEAMRLALKRLGVDVEWRTSVTSLARVDGSPINSRGTADSTLDDEAIVVNVNRVDGGKAEAIRCKFVVAADGVHSFVRHALNMSYEGRLIDNVRVLAADVDIESNAEMQGMRSRCVCV
jgi:2-polyprenyl-6-methoxyphenol hydroxylase-like FAD-dependent oxidoreductase